MTIFPLRFWVIGAFLLWTFMQPVKAEPMAAAEQGNVRVVVYTEDCALTNVVENLTKRATWTENGKTLEGCAGIFPQVGMVLFYFTDKTMFPVPMQIFSRVSNT